MNTESPLNLMDLPPELRLDIFERLDIEDLIHIHKTIPQDRNLIERVFRNMFKDHILRIVSDWLGREIQIFYDEVKVADINYEDISENLVNVLDLLRYFGHCISKLEILYYSSVDSRLRESLHQHISKYSAKYVNEIEFYLKYSSMNRIMADLIVPFPKVKVARLDCGNIEAATLHQMFPAVQSFDLEVRITKSLGHFANLKYLKMPVSWGTSKANLFKRTLEANPQIMHISIPECSLDFLRMMNIIRPDLKSLDISKLNFYGHENVTVQLRFASMKVFKCRINGQWYERDADRIAMEFGNLEEILFNRRDL